MADFYGKYYNQFYGPLYGSVIEQEGLVTITGQLDIADGSGNSDAIVVRQINDVFNHDGKQVVRKSIYVLPNEITHEWSVNLYPSNYYFYFKEGQNQIREAKIVATSTSYENLEDYTGT